MPSDYSAAFPLLEDFFSQDSAVRLSADISAIFRCPFMVVNDTFHIVMHHSLPGFSDKVYDGAIARGEITYEAGLVIDESRELAEGKPVYIQIADSPYPRRFSPLVSSGILLGYFICTDHDGHIKDMDEDVFSAAEKVLAKQLFVDASRGNDFSGTAEELLVHLLDGDFSSESYFTLRLSQTFLADFHPSAFALIDVRKYHSMYLGSNQLKDELSYHFYASHPFMYQGNVFMFLHHDHNLSDFNTLADEFHIKTVISDKIESLFDLPKLYTTARDAMDIISAEDFDCGNVFTVSALSHVVMLSKLAKRLDLILPEVKALYRYDRENDSRLCETLYYYLASGHSLQYTCEALFTHRNTILYRIKKIKDEFGVPLDDPTVGAALLLSLSVSLYISNGAAFFKPMAIE